MKVLFLTQTTEKGPATRYRVSQYLDHFKQNGLQVLISSALPDSLYDFFYSGSSPFKKILCLPVIFLRRMIDLFRAKAFDVVFIQRQVLPQCFPLFEMIISRLNKNIVFDFDDALFLVPPQRKSLVYGLRDKRAVERIIRHSRLVIAGNDFLADYAAQYNQNVETVPTAVDIQKWKRQDNPAGTPKKIILGWIGSEHTVFYLNELKDVLQKLSKEFDICLHIVGDKNKSFHCPGVDVVHIEWDVDSEVRQVSGFDIGIAPLDEGQWAKGKCGLKAIQYMACSVAAVCSDSGVFRQIVRDGVNGFLASDENQWYEKIKTLIKDKELRQEMGRQGRETVAEKYSAQSNKDRLMRIIERAAQPEDR